MTEGTISPWMPEQSRSRLAILGKLAEECGELAARASRCIVQGLDELDPDTGRTNREELRREIADVEACMYMADKWMGVAFDPARAQMKAAGFIKWQGLIAEAESNA